MCNVTTLGEAADAPWQSERTFRLLFTKNPQPTWVYDLETLRFLEVNEAAVRQYGYSRDEFLTMEITRIRPAEDLPAFWTDVQSVHDDAPYTGQHRHRVKTGEVIDVQINAHLLSFTGRAAALVVAQDISARLHAEEALRQSEARYRGVIDASPDGIVQISLAGVVTMANQQAADLHGFAPPDELVGTDMLEMISPEDRPRALEDLRRVATGGYANNVEHTLLRRDRSTFVAEMNVALMRDALGQPEAFIVVVRDITVQVHARRALEDLARQNAVLAAQREAIMEQMPSGLILLDAAGTVTLINEVGRRISGAPPDWARPLAEQSVDYALRDVMTNRPLAPEETPVARALRGERVEGYDCVFRRSDASTDTWVRSSATPVRGPEGRITGAVVVFSDVTEERLLLRQLAVSEEQRRTVYDALSCGVLVRDRTGQIIHVNPTAETLFLLTPEAVGATPYSSWQALREDGMALPREELPALVALRTGAAQRVQTVSFVCLDGRRLWLQGDAVPVLDANGHVAQVVESFIDITARKEGEDRLRHQLAFTHAITESVGEGIYALDQAGRLTFMNPAAERLLGWSEAELRGADMHEAIHFQRADGTLVAAEDCPLLGVLRSGVAVSEEDDVFTRKDGTLLPVAYTSAPIQAEGQVAGAVLTFHDITAQKRATEALRKQAQLREGLTTLALLTTAGLDPATLFRDICTAASSAFGVVNAGIWLLEGQETVRLHMSLLAGFAPGITVPLHSPIAAARAIRERRVVVASFHQPEIQREVGAILAQYPPIDANMAAPISIGGEIEGALSLAAAEAERFTEADFAAVSQVAVAIGQALYNARLYAREQELNARLRQMERWRGSFVRLMGHELRTPLGHVLGFADLLSAERDRLSPARQRHLAHLQTGALRLQALIERMFEIMSLFTGEDVLARAPVNLTYLLATALSAQRGRADEAGITMTVGLPTTPLTVLGDEPRLSRLLTIVLDNALRYTPPGGSVAVTLAAVGAGVEARIADSGPGIAPELQEYVFSGAQAEDVLTREHGGLGLSLLLARRIAEAHGGALRLDQPVQGACVVLWLPTPRPLGSAAAAPEGDGTRGR